MALKLTTYYSMADLPTLPEARTFHSSELFEVYEATPGYDPIMVVATDEGVVMAQMLAVVQKKVRFYTPRIRRTQVYGEGAYYCTDDKKAEIFDQMLGYLTGILLKRCSVIEFRDISTPVFGYGSFKANKYFAVRWLRVRNVLQEGESLENGFVKSYQRDIRRALERGAVVREAENLEEIRAYAVMLHHNYSSKIRKHFPSREFFEKLQSFPLAKEGKTRTFLVWCGDKIIGGSTCVYSGDTAYLWFSGGLRKTYPRYYPGLLAVWGALDDARRRGYKYFEFADVGLPFRHHGYRDFVLNFGGNQLSTRRWFRFRNKHINSLFRWLYK